jgi:hypothetical protein
VKECSCCYGLESWVDDEVGYGCRCGYWQQAAAAKLLVFGNDPIEVQTPSEKRICCNNATVLGNGSVIIVPAHCMFTLAWNVESLFWIDGISP